MKATHNPKAPYKWAQGIHDKMNKAGVHMAYKAVAMHDGGLKELVSIRLRQTERTGIWSACLWVPAYGEPTQGTPQGTGRDDYQSRAVFKAFASAGYAIDKPEGNAIGDESTRNAIKAVCALHGYPDIHIVQFP